jgi:hypothetical protein
MNSLIPKLNLRIICDQGGEESATRADVESVNTPLGTRSWRPLQHSAFIERFYDAAHHAGVTVSQAHHILARDGLRYFGLFQVDLPTDHGEIATIFGLRNSHDKSCSAGMMAGDAPFICSNLCFSNEITIGRKHTSGVTWNEIGALLNNAFERLADSKVNMDRRITAAKDISLPDASAYDVAVRGYRAGACTRGQLAKVIDQWHEPEHDAFKPRTLWSLQNAFSNVWRKTPNLTPGRSEALQRTFEPWLRSHSFFAAQSIEV